MSAIWITWEIQRRNRTMAAAVGAVLHEMDYRGGRLARYWALSRRTMRVIRATRPEQIFFQNPSLVLALLIATLRFFGYTRARTIGDFHNGGVFPPAGGFLLPWIVRNSDLIIVSNRNLEPAITALGGRCISVPDPIPTIEPATAQTATGGRFEVFFICTWAADEPIVEVLNAAKILAAADRGITITITGRPKLERVGWREPVPANVELAGFLAEADFEQRLAMTSCALDLTTRADCMVCGAYEAVSAEVPMIVSGNEPTRLYFSKGARFTDNSAPDIAQAIRDVRQRHVQLKREVVELKHELLETERSTLQRLRERAASPS